MSAADSYGGIRLDNLFKVHAGDNPAAGISPFVSVSFALLAMGVSLLDINPKARVALHEVIAILVGLVMAVVVTTYVFAGIRQRQMESFSSMSIVEAFAFVCAASALFLARPKRSLARMTLSDRMSGIMIRNLVPGAIVMPMILALVAQELVRVKLLDAGSSLVVFTLGLMGGMIALAAFSAFALRRIEDKVLQAQDELEMRVEERTDQLSQSLARMETFGYALSHDLRSPLRTVSGYLNLLEEEHADGLGDVGTSYVQRGKEGARRMKELIEGLTALLRSTRAEVRPEPLDLSGLAAEIAADLAVAHPERSVDIEIEPDLRATADRRLMASVLENLLGNAWKFTSKRHDPQIAVGIVNEEGGATFFVRDNGAGFRSSEAERAFEPFTRLHTHEEFDGSGIGLATVRSIIEQHGGRVWIRGEQEVGATVFFTLPSRNGKMPD